jgi:hypothetical protein
MIFAFTVCLSLRFDATGCIVNFIIGEHGKVNALKLPVGVPRALVRVVDCDTDTDNRTAAMNCLNSIASKAPASVLTDNEAVACALRVVQRQGTGAQPVPSPIIPPAAC